MNVKSERIAVILRIKTKYIFRRRKKSKRTEKHADEYKEKKKKKRDKKEQVKL